LSFVVVVVVVVVVVAINDFKLNMSHGELCVTITVPLFP
jgi:hypothetical protein